MTPPRKCTVTKACLLSAILLVATPAFAESVGTVTALSGRLVARGGNGAIKVLALDSTLEEGDTLVTRNDSYANVSFTDQSTATLGPETEVRIEKYSFRDDQASNGAALGLARGRVRITVGSLGTHSTDGFILMTPSATLDVRHSIFIAEYVASDHNEVAWRDAAPQTPSVKLVAVAYTVGLDDPMGMSSFGARASQARAPNAWLRLAQNTGANGSSGLPPGLYVQVLDGAIHLSNPAGTQNFAAGQFGYTSSIKQPPVIVPSNPGIQFSPPPAFSSPSAPTGGTHTNSPSPAVDCVVR
jgi:hypothetical protein